MDLTTEPKVYRSPVMQMRCAQEAMLGQNVAYLKNPQTGEVEYDNFYRGKLWADADDDYSTYPTPRDIAISKMIARRLIWC